MATRMQQRRGTAAAWAAANPVLADGEIGFEHDTGVIKVGDGVTAWLALPAPYVTRSLVDAKGDIFVGTADNTVARLAAGTVGQRLTVQADGSLAWQAPSVDIPASIEDVKGDLIVGTGADTYARLPVGADKKIPVADSTQATGIRWDQPRLLSCTSTTRPAAPTTDTLIFETDTGRLLYWNGAAWVIITDTATVIDRENWTPGVSTAWTWPDGGGSGGTRLRLRAPTVTSPGHVQAQGLMVCGPGSPYANNLFCTIPYGNGTAASGHILGTWAVERGGSTIAGGWLRSQASSTECQCWTYSGGCYFFQPSAGDHFVCSFNYPITI